MNKFIICVLLLINTGCISSIVKETVDTIDGQIRLKWSEEWKPFLHAEFENSLADAKLALLNQIKLEMELQEQKVNSKLETVNIKLSDFDSNNDGSVTGLETLNLVKELKNAKDKEGNPLSWGEILMAVILGYGGTTAGKEWLKSKTTKLEQLESVERRKIK